VLFERPPRWRRFLKDAVAAALSHTRSLTSFAQPVAGGFRPLVIGYHRVVEDFERAASTDMPTMLVSRAMFERHVEWIGRHFEFVSLDEIGINIERGEPFSRPVATITFDDGYRDVYEHAVPTLMRVGAAATVFIVTDQVDRESWQIHDRMYYLLARSYEKCQEPWRRLAALLANAEISSAVIDQLRVSSTNPYELTSVLLPAISQAQAGLVMDLLHAELGDERESVPRTMTWSMVRDLYRAGLTIGSHTRTHAWLANETPEKRLDEIAGSKRDLEERLGQAVRHFAYPGGQFTPPIVDLVARAGYRFAYTACDHRDARHPALTIDRLFLWEGSSITSGGRFSPSILSCQAHRLWPSARRCDRVHAA
jgi:peptidoglycan/xylan/chitin deacetylase (PgdA/CDA1 family)